MGKSAIGSYQNVKKTAAEKQAFNQMILNHETDEESKPRLEQRKNEAGLGGRADIKTFIDLIDADEKRHV